MEKILKCPVCGEEYLPGEIFYPKYIIGNPKNIIKNDSGKIEYWEDEDLVNTESYICDKCNTALKFNVNIDYSVEVDNKYNFNEESSTKLFNNERIELKEE